MKLSVLLKLLLRTTLKSHLSTSVIGLVTSFIDFKLPPREKAAPSSPSPAAKARQDAEFDEQVTTPLQVRRLHVVTPHRATIISPLKSLVLFIKYLYIVY